MLKSVPLFIFSVVFFRFSAECQELKLNLQMSTEKNAALPVGTAVLLHLPDSAVVSTKTIRDKQSFSVKPQTTYFLQLSASGMKPINSSVFVQDSSLLLNFKWEIKTNDLNNVTVIARKPLIKQEDDKTVVDAEVMASSSTNAYEVLEKTPGAVVDQDGAVYLNSATPATIQINGREVKLSAADLASLLKSLPANSVTKIEILRTPSAKYDAASSGGIINIVLKKGVKLGTSGSLNVAFFQGRFNTKTAGFNLNRSFSKVNTTLSYQFTDRNNFEEINSSRFILSDSAEVKQISYTKYPALNHYLGGGIDAELSKKWTAGYDFRMSANNGKSSAQNDIDIAYKNSQSVPGKNQSIISNKNDYYYISNNWYANYKIDSLGSKWETEADFDYFNNGTRQQYNNRSFLPASFSLLGDGNISSRKNVFSVETDLTLKLPQTYTVETGGKFSYSKSRNSAIYFTDNGSGPQPDSFQSNKFRYTETIASAYLQVARTFAGFNVKPGLRVEHTNISGNQYFPTDTSLKIKRTDFFPYIYVRHNIAKVFGFKLVGSTIYRRSISRPYYEALNPYPKYIDQYLYEVGNPRLRPQFTNNYEFNIMADDFPIFSIGLNDIKDIFTNVTYQDDSTKIAFRTYDNLGRNKEMYLRFVGGIPPGGKYFFYMGGQYNESNYTGLYQGRPLNYKRGSWTFFMYHNYKPTPTFNVSLNGFMRLKGLQNFYELKTFGQLNMSLNKAILKKKMNIILAGNDILGTNRYRFDINQAGVIANGKRVNDTRRIGLTIRYNFGIKPKEDKQQSFGSPAEGIGN
jgi:iron complex outermembrane recepter protein